MNLAEELKAMTTVLERPEELTAYAVDGRSPALVALPASEAEVASCLKAAGRHGAGVAPRGAGSKPDLGNLPERLDLSLSVERLNQVVEYVPADLTVTVQAGMRLSDLQALAARHGQMVPLDPVRSETATVGGIVATGGYGPRRMAYGSVRDILLGTRIALADGRVIKTGGRVVKNVAGYDMNKLVVGSLGTLGVITEVSLKLRPVSPATQTLLIGFAGLEQGLAAAEAVLNSELVPASVVLLGPGAAARLEAPGPVALAVELAETVPNLAYQAARLPALVGSVPAEPVSLTGPEEARFWSNVRDYGDRFGAGYRLRVNALVSDLAAEMAAGTPEAVPGVAEECIAYVGTGTLLVYGFGSETAALSESVRARFRRAGSARATAVLEAAPPAVKAGLDVWGPRRPEWRFLEGIKQAHDPGRLLNPGRYAGGI